MTTTTQQPNDGKKQTWQWVLGISLTLVSLGGFKESFFIGLFILLAGLLIIPAISEKLKIMFPVWNNKYLRIGLPLVLVLISALQISKKEEKQIAIEKEQNAPIEARRDFVKGFMQDTSSKTVLNITELAKIAKAYEHNSSYRGTFDKSYLVEKFDSVTGINTIIFDPQFNFKDNEAFLKKSGNKVLKNYVIQFDFPANDNKTATVRSVLYFSGTGEGNSYSADSVPDYNIFVNKKEVDKKLAEIELKAKQERIDKQNAEWKDKHWKDAKVALRIWADKNLIDPKKYTEGEAYPYGDGKWMAWRRCEAKNRYGVYLTVTIRGLFDLEGNALAIGID